MMFQCCRGVWSLRGSCLQGPSEAEVGPDNKNWSYHWVSRYCERQMHRAAWSWRWNNALRKPFRNQASHKHTKACRARGNTRKSDSTCISETQGHRDRVHPAHIHIHIQSAEQKLCVSGGRGISANTATSTATIQVRQEEIRCNVTQQLASVWTSGVWPWAVYFRHI